MVYFITGRKNSGKTTLAYYLKEILKGYGESVVVLDGDEIRSEFPIGYMDAERRRRTHAIGRLARFFERQGAVPIIALLSEKREWRVRARRLFRESMLIYLPGGHGPEGVVYEVPDADELGKA